MKINFIYFYFLFFPHFEHSAMNVSLHIYSIRIDQPSIGMCALCYLFRQEDANKIKGAFYNIIGTPYDPIRTSCRILITTDQTLGQSYNIL